MKKQLTCIALLMASTGYAQDISTIHSDAVNDRVHAKYSLGTPAHQWASNQINWYYNPLLQPASVSTEAAVNIIKAAANRWSGMCNVTFNYLGTTNASPNIYGAASTVDSQNVVGWGVPQAPDLANMLMFKKWWYTDNSLADADVLFNATWGLGVTDLDGAATVGFGAILGLMTSNVNASVMTSDATRSSSYMRTLRGDDAAGCAALYGAASTAESNRAFNWAEAAFPQILTPSPAPSGSAMGYYYRYYSGTNSYVGTKDGSVFYMGPDGVIQNLGPLSSYADRVQSAGF